MSADHKGPLAAFVVVAVVAAILLVTSVRSQAEPGWLGRQLPSAVAVVAPTTVSAPGLVTAISGHLDLAVASGTVLVRKAATATPAVVQQVALVDATVTPPRHRVHSHAARSGSVTSTHLPTRAHAHGGHRGGGPRWLRDHRAAWTHASTRHDHGRHLGWVRAHGHGAHGHGAHGH